MDATDIAELIGTGIGALALGYSSAYLLTFFKRLLENI